MPRLIAFTVIAAVVAPTTTFAAPLFTFDDALLGATTPFTAVSDGLSAAFTGPSSVDPGAFEVSYNSSSGPFGAPYRTLNDGFLTTGPAFGAPGSALTISFSAPLSAISLAFALDDPANTTTLSLVTSTGGTASASGALSAGFRYPEGTLSVSGDPFTAVTLRSDALDFQIDDVAATPAAGTAVPEPASLATLLAGLSMIAFWRRPRG